MIIPENYSPASLTREIAIDTALLQAATSYFRGEIADPRAPECFAAVATPYCNGAGLIVPLLNAEAREAELPAMYGWWKTKRTVIGGIEAAGEIKRSVYEAFESYVETHPERVAEWLTFQFSTEPRSQNFTDPEREDFDRDIAATNAMLDLKRIPRFAAAVQEQAAAWKLPTEVTRSWSRSRLHLGVGFALSLFLRGWLYGWALKREPSQPPYRHFWLRKAALEQDPVDGVERRKGGSVAFFPWGEILVMTVPNTNESLLHEAATALREGANAFVGDYAAAVDEDERQNRTIARETVALKALQRAGVTLELKRKSSIQWLGSLLRRVIGLAADVQLKKQGLLPVGNIAVELISAKLPKNWTKGVESRITLAFRRDRYWDLFDDPGIRKLLTSTIRPASGTSDRARR